MAKSIDKKLVFGCLPPRGEDSNKSTFGRVLNVSGSKNFIGAAYLSSISALKIGAGYVTLACPDIIVPIIAQMAPEITFLPLNSTDFGSISCDNQIKDFETDIKAVGTIEQIEYQNSNEKNIFIPLR